MIAQGQIAGAERGGTTAVQGNGSTQGSAVVCKDNTASGNVSAPRPDAGGERYLTTQGRRVGRRTQVNSRRLSVDRFERGRGAACVCAIAIVKGRYRMEAECQRTSAEAGGTSVIESFSDQNDSIIREGDCAGRSAGSTPDRD